MIAHESTLAKTTRLSRKSGRDRKSITKPSKTLTGRHNSATRHESSATKTNRLSRKSGRDTSRVISHVVRFFKI